VELRVREAGLSDATAVRGLLEELAAGEGETPDVAADDVRRFLIDDRRTALVATLGDEVIGLLAYAVYPSFFRSADWAQAGFLIVASHARRRGAGRLLVETACRECAARGLHEVQIATLPHNEAARRLYRRCGFVERTVGMERRLDAAQDEPHGARGAAAVDRVADEAGPTDKPVDRTDEGSSRPLGDAGRSGVTVRDAGSGDEEVITELVLELARLEGEAGATTPQLAAEYLAFPLSGALLAELDGRVAGLLTWFVRPGLFHGGPWGCIDELIVRQQARGHGVGDALLAEAMRRFEAAGCREVSVSTMPDNEPAKALYRKHGMVDEGLLLERHF
jgi:ribosomal protein S18 acetylase RimI-like enzyme